MGEDLVGGTRARVVRHGDRVVRSRHWPISSHTYPALRLLAARDWSGAPRLLVAGPVEELEFLPGLVPPRESVPEWAKTAESLRALGRLIRELHDITAGSATADGAETLCHNDLSPANTVYSAESRLPYAFIDWDLAAPGTRISDLGHAAWQWLLGPGVDIPAAATGTRALLEGYEFTGSAREVIAAAVRCQRETADGIEAGAATDSALAVLVHKGVPARCRAVAEWTLTHLDELAAR